MKLNVSSILVFSLLAFSLFAAESVAVGISSSTKFAAYAPGEEQQFTYYLVNAPLIEAYLTEELAPYARIVDAEPNGGARTITVLLTIPEGLSPGRHRLIVGARESAPEGVMVGGRAAIQVPLYVDVPYPGVYLEASLAAYDINVGEKEKFSVAVSNKGKDAASRVSVKVEVFDSANNRIAELAGAEKSLAGLGSANFELEWDSSGATAGNYRAVATITYDGNELATEAKFRIGSLDVKIRDYTRELGANAINPFFIEIESNWNEEITGIYGELIVAGKSFKTPAFDLNPWQTVNLTGYADTRGIAEGEYDATFIVYYAGKSAEQAGKILIAKGAGTEPAQETPGKLGTGLTATAIAAIMLGVVFIAALVVLVLVAKQKNKR